MMTSEALYSSGRVPDQREPRLGKMFLAKLHCARLASEEIRICNVSRNGIGAKSRGAMPLVGEEVTIETSAFGDVRGVVRWVKDRQFGIELSAEVDPGLLNFADKSWDVANRPFDANHVFNQFRPSGDCRRPGLKVR